MSNQNIQTRINHLHRHGIIDMHFDLLLDLYEKRDEPAVIASDFLPDFEAGDMGIIAAAIYIQDQYLPEMAMRVGLGQVARLYAEVDQTPQLAICRTYDDIISTRQADKIAMLITMEGVEPLAGDLNLLRVFYEAGLRSLGLTHARRNAAGSGGVFAATGSSKDGLTKFGRQVVEQCEALGIILDLAHLNPAGFDEVMAMTTRPLIISHTNPRRYYDVERNNSETQIKQVADRGGVVGANSILLSQDPAKVTLDHYVDHIEFMINIAGVEGVGLGFDFFKFIYDVLPAKFLATLPEVTFMPDFTDHSHTRNLTRKLIERGFSDDVLEKLLYGNFMRIFEAWLKN